MSATKNYPFTDVNNYTIPATAQIDSGKLSLKLQDNSSQSFIQTYDSDAGFTYDNTKAEFTGTQLQQKDMRPTNAIFYASYNTDENADWSDGSGTGTLGGGATVSGGELDCTGGGVAYVKYASTGNVGLNVGCIRIKWKPNYTGAPPSEYTIYTDPENVSGINRMELYHDNAGILRMKVYQIGAFFSENFGAWSPVSGTEYEFEINYDFSTHVRLFIDGVTKDVQKNCSGARTAQGDLYFGTNYNASSTFDGSFSDILLFDTVQHTGASYTPDWSDIYETIYLGSSVTEPVHTYSGAGSIQSFDTSLITSSGAPRLIYNNLYWTGSVWGASDGTYAQASSPATIATNISTIPFSDTLTRKIVFDDSNTQSSISNNQTDYTGQIYSTTNPTTIALSDFRSDGIISFTATSTITGSDQIKYRWTKDGTKYYYNTVDEAWEVSDGSYSQSNTAAEMNTYSSTFLSTGLGADIALEIDLHSNDGTTTPELDLITIVYDIFGEAISDATLCLVYGWVRTNNVAVQGAIITISPSNDVSMYGDTGIEILESYSKTTNAVGYWEQELPVTVNLDVTYNITIFYQNSNGNVFRREYTGLIIPNQASVNIAELD